MAALGSRVAIQMRCILSGPWAESVNEKLMRGLAMPTEGRTTARWVLAVASTIASTLAIVSLARHALLLRTLSAPMELILSAYAATMQVLLGWIERSLQGTLSWIGGFIDWRPTLYSHWRDMLVVVAIWTSALVWARWRAFAARWSASVHDGMFGFHHLFAFSFAFLVIVVGGLMMVIIAGILPIRSSDIGVQVLVATSPWLVFAVAMLIGRVMRRHEALVIVVLAGIAALATWWLSQALGSSIGLGVVGFGASVIIVGVMFLVFGVALVLSHGTPFLQSPVQYGVYILSGFAGALLFYAIDAGLRLLGA